MPGLAEEVAAFKANRGAPAPTETPTSAADAAAAEHFGSVAPLPKPASQPNLDPNAPAAPPAAPAQPAATAAAPAPETKIVINGQTFDTVDAAIAYANDLAAVTAQQDALIQGMQSVKTAQSAAPEAKTEKSLDEIVEEKLFEDPKTALKMLREGITREVMQTQQATAQRQAEIQKMWSDFYDANQDLSEDRDLVEYTLQKNWATLQNMPIPQASKLLAAETRKIVHRARTSAAPGKELPTTPAVVPGASGAPVATQDPGESAPLDFMTQLRNLKSRKAK